MTQVGRPGGLRSKSGVYGQLGQTLADMKWKYREEKILKKTPVTRQNWLIHEPS